MLSESLISFCYLGFCKDIVEKYPQLYQGKLLSISFLVKTLLAAEKELLMKITVHSFCQHSW